MQLKTVLQNELDRAYDSTIHLMKMVDDTDLNWKPASGNNWMNMAQLLKHLATPNSFIFQGFISDKWPVDPESFENLKLEDTFPPLDQMPGITSVAEAIEELNADRDTTMEELNKSSNEQLSTKPAPLPWDRDKVLFHRLLGSIEHFNMHKAQLFYYLKLLGKPVNTLDLHFAGKS
jgi:uncharacterized damage-inducible protein DinB